MDNVAPIANFVIKTNDDGAPEFVINSDGNVGIGITNPSVGLQVGNPVLNETKQVVFNSEGGVPA